MSQTTSFSQFQRSPDERPDERLEERPAEQRAPDQSFASNQSARSSLRASRTGEIVETGVNLGLILLSIVALVGAGGIIYLTVIEP